LFTVFGEPDVKIDRSERIADAHEVELATVSSEAEVDAFVEQLLDMVERGRPV
jgi:hypothetical protein